ncbi:Solute carrier family 15 member 4 [Holothuria leucospilota]|uniref:Solute carrier family 15 member 4 n=1 Tax=Holothuria leucospilota TaxID=206669 RepID=A0A9Q0YI94_HOLLE|nr:Solute carrier family 15 member 4 [Holothuria leucospilota]
MSTTSESSTETSSLIEKNTKTSAKNNCSPKDGLEDDNSSFWKTGSRNVLLCILFLQLCERVTFYSISGNIVLFCTSELKIDSPTAATISLAFHGCCYFVPVFGGYIADTVAGKFNIILASAVLYLIGAAILPVISCEYAEDISYEMKQYLFGVSLLLVAIGTGGVSASLSPFGAQQLEESGEGAIRSFFSWIYWFINMGSAIAFLLVGYIQQEISFFLGFLIAAICILLANGLLLYQCHNYVTYPPEGSALTNIVKVVTAVSFRCHHGNESNKGMNLKDRFDYSKESNGGKFPDGDVENTKTVLRILPIFSTFVLYWTLHNQMYSTFFLQGERLRVKYNHFTIPVVVLNLSNNVVILMLLPLLDRFLYPILDQLGINFSQLKRISIGMVLAILGMIIAAIVEIQRKNIMLQGHYLQQNLSKEVFNASDLSVLAQIPQFALIGASEVFAGNTGQEFAYSQAPYALQSVLMGLYLFTSGLGSYMGSLLVVVVNRISGASGNEWLPNEPNHGHLEYVFFTLAGLMTLNFFFYLWACGRYEYVQPGVKTSNKYDEDGKSISLDSIIIQKEKDESLF